MKAIYSRIDWEDNIQISKFYTMIQDLLNHEEVKKLDNYHQHLNTSRFQHSFNVAYYTFWVCEKMNWNTKEATRAALLHDLFFYDWRKHNHGGWHPKVHPQVALKNAQQICEVTPMMADAIVKHMWPMTLNIPKYKEGWVITMMDKYCATCEIIRSSSIKFKSIKVALTLFALIFMMNQ